MIHQRMNFLLGFLCTVLLLLVTLPYFLAGRAGGQEYIFGGFLINPLDGNSYLAKMVQGWSGSWRFQLPYTAETGKGAYLYIYYLFLGHAARWLGSSLNSIYQVARLVGVIALLIALLRFFRSVLSEPYLVAAAFTLALLGSGMGWLGIPFGLITSDLWVAEAYPFLSAYSSPHFSLGLALLIWLLTLNRASDEQQDAGSRSINWRSLWVVPVAFLLGCLSPFGVVLGGVVLAGTWLAEWWAAGWKIHWMGTSTRLLLLLAGGVPVIVYDYWAVHSDPLLSAWNSQNLTPAPPFYDVILSFSPLIFLAAAGIWFVFRQRLRRMYLPAVWLLASMVLLYLPFGLQRRFMMGLFVPVVSLGILVLWKLSHDRLNRFAMYTVIVLLLVIPTNLLVLQLGSLAAQKHDGLVYYRSAEGRAMDWLRENTDQDALVLTGPEMGMFIPAHTGRRVIYGHPFETVNAADEEQAVIDFYKGMAPALVRERGVDYIFVGPRERELGGFQPESSWKVVYDDSGVVVYAVED